MARDQSGNDIVRAILEGQTGVSRTDKSVQSTTITNSTAETTIVTAVSGTYLDLYGLILANTSASATEVTIRDKTSTGTARSLYVPAGETRGFMLDASDGIQQAEVNNNWTATCGTAVTSLKVTALYTKVSA